MRISVFRSSCFLFQAGGSYRSDNIFLFDCNIKTCIFFLFFTFSGCQTKVGDLGKKRNCLEFNFHFRPDRKMLWQKRPRKKQAHRYSHICSGRSTSILFFKGFFWLSVKNEICIFLFLWAEKMPQGYIVGWAQKVRTLLFSKASRSFSLKPKTKKILTLIHFQSNISDSN